MSILFIILGVSFAVALVVFLFSMLWYSKFLFKSTLDAILSEKDVNFKKALLIEFSSSFLLSLATVIVFAPYNLTFGLINGVFVVLGILLPIAISNSAWENNSFKELSIKLGHRFLQIILCFTFAGVLNNIVMPYMLNMM